MSFESILELPDSMSSQAVLTRLIDGLGFRFYWSVEGLSEGDYEFKPAEDLMSIGELIFHIEELVIMCRSSFNRKETSISSSVEESIKSSLSQLEELKGIIKNLDDEDLMQIKIKGFPIWNMINGPMADALTHVGQINAYRRMNGNPCSPVSVFVGKPKTKK